MKMVVTTKKESKGGDIQKLLSKIPFTTTGIKGELHIPGHSFAGPGTNLQLRLNSDDTPKEWSIPIDRDDAIAYQHDLAYREAERAGDDLTKKHDADRLMLQQLNAITDPTIRERLDRLLIKAAIGAKLKLGIGLNGETNKQRLADELHKPYRKPPMLLKVKVFGKDEIWSCDLVEMPIENLGRGGKYKYILTVIDLYTRYAWAIPLRDKTGNTVKEAFRKIFKDSGRNPKKLWCDRGKEFYNGVMKNFLKGNSIEIYSTNNDGKTVVVERLNRSLKQIMWKRFTVQGNQKWVGILTELVNQYNNKVHRMIKTTPTIASENPDKIKDLINENNYENENKMKKTRRKFSVGNRVRIYKYQYIFTKGFVSKWSDEIFKISEVLSTVPVTYRIRALDGEEIEGTFYENELQKTEF
jgi:hypothetical protein